MLTRLLRQWPVAVVGAGLGAAVVVGIILTIGTPGSDRPPAAPLRDGRDVVDDQVGDADARDLPVRYTSPSHGGEPLAAVAFSPDGGLVVAGGGEGPGGFMDVWEVHPDPAADLVHAAVIPHDAPVESLAFSREGDLLASATGSTTVHLWDPVTLENVDAFEHDHPVTSLAFSPTADVLAVGTRGSRAVPVETPDGPDELLLFVWSVELWDVATGQHLVSLTQPSDRTAGGPEGNDPPTIVAFSPDGGRLASGFGYGEDSTLVHIWSLSTLDIVASIHDAQNVNDQVGWARSLEFSPDGRLLAVGGIWGRAGLWDPASTQLIDNPRVGSHHQDTVLTVAFSPTGNTLATGVWSVSGRRFGITCLIVDVEGTAPHDGCRWPVTEPPHPEQGGGASYHDGTVNAVAFSPDGHLLASGDQSGALWVHPDPETP